MKKLILLLAVLLLAGCEGNDANDPAKCREAVMIEFGSSDVTAPGPARFVFIVRATDNSVWEVSCESGSSPKPTRKSLLFPPR